MSISREKDFKAPPSPKERELSRLMEALGTIEDLRQEAKVRHPIAQVVLLVVAAVAGNARTWVDIELYGKAFADTLRRYLHIERVPSHDTIQRVMGLVSPAVLARICLMWCDMMDFEAETPESLRGLKLLNIDGKTLRGSGGRGRRAVHIESAFDPQRGVCLGQMAVDEKSNETAAIPKILEALDLHGYIVTSDAMGTQVGIARQIREQGGEYVLALKGNQGSMAESVAELAQDGDFLKDLARRGCHWKTVEKARGQIETREYWITDQIDGWLPRQDEWAGLRCVGISRNSTKKDGRATVAWRCFLTSLPPDVELFAEAVRGHWRIEAMHNVLDVTLGEDANRTIDRTAAENLAVARKWMYSILRHVDIGSKASMRSKAGCLSHDPEPVLRMLSVAS